MKYLNERTTVSCYSLYMSWEGTIQLSTQGMLATDRSQLISLLKTALKYVATLSFTEGLSGSPLNLHAIVSNSHPVFRKYLVCIPLDVLTEVRSILVLLTHCGRVTQIWVFKRLKLGTSVSSP